MSWRSALLGLLVGAVSQAAQAHDFKAGDLRIDHPYATPSAPGLKTGAVYFRAIKNRGAQSDRLLSASTPVAARVDDTWGAQRVLGQHGSDPAHVEAAWLQA